MDGNWEGGKYVWMVDWWDGVVDSGWWMGVSERVDRSKHWMMNGKE